MAASRQRRRTSVTQQQEAAIAEGVARGKSAPEIHHEVAQNGIPSLRTVQEIAKATRDRDESGAWSAAEAPAEDAALLLPVLAALVEKSVVLTVDAASWALRVRKMAPDLLPFAAYQVALLYRQRRQRSLPAGDLDTLLAFAPWRGPGAWQRYKDAVELGRLPEIGRTVRIKEPVLLWVLARSYRDMLRRMGFRASEIDAAGGTGYQGLLAIRSDLETKGIANQQEGEIDGD